MRMNVLLVMVDSLRADRCWGEERRCLTPFLDDLRRSSTVFTRAFSTASMTTICTASLLTGTYPFVHGIRSLAGRRLRPDLPTLAEAFRAGGYYTWAEVTGPLLAMTGLDRGFDEYGYREYTQWLDTSFGEGLIAKLRGNLPAPWFGFLHLWEIHYPRRVAAKYNRPHYGQNSYERAVSSLDHQLKRLLEALPPAGNTAVILTGDHGEYLSPSKGGEFVAGLKGPTAWLKRRVPGVKKLKRRVMKSLFKTLDRLDQGNGDFSRAWFGHGFHVYEPLVHVPLLMYGPGLFPGGLEISRPVSHIDIFPTLVSALNLPRPSRLPLNGMDLMPVVREPVRHADDRGIYLEASGERSRARPEQWLTALRTARYKYVRGLHNETLPEELYDLDHDPGERENLAGLLPELVGTMRARLSELMQSAPLPQFEAETAYSPAELAQLQGRLRELGYMD